MPLYRRMVPQVIRWNQNHPSWYAWSAGNEFLSQTAPWRQYLDEAYAAFRRTDPSRLFIASEGTALEPMDAVTEANSFVAEPLHQPFRGAVAEVAQFERVLSPDDIAALARPRPDYGKVVKALQPVGYWPLTDRAALRIAESSQASLDGAAGKDVVPDDIGPIPGQPGGMRFAGDGFGISLSNAATLVFPKDDEPFTASLWVRPRAFARGDFGTPLAWGAALPGSAVLLSMDGEEGSGRVLVGRWMANVLRSERTLRPGEWNHLALSYDGRTLRLYVDGRPDASAPVRLTTKVADGRIGNVVGKKVAAAGVRPHLWHEFNNAYAGALPDLTLAGRYTG